VVCIPHIQAYKRQIGEANRCINFSARHHLQPEVKIIELVIIHIGRVSNLNEYYQECRECPTEIDCQNALMMQHAIYAPNVLNAFIYNIKGTTQETQTQCISVEVIDVQSHALTPINWAIVLK